MESNNFMEPRATGSSRVNVGQTEQIISGVGGALFLTAGFKNITRNPAAALGYLILGGYLAYKGATGYCPISEALGRQSVQQKPQSITIRETMTVNRSKDEVYNYWRRLENLPRFMRHIKEVKQLDNKRSHWEAIAPKAIGPVKWEAEIVDEREGELISWRSIEGSMVDNAGHVTFRDGAGNNSTMIEATISYIPPAGQVGKAVARMLNPTLESMVKEDLSRFKTMLEAGELILDSAPLATATNNTTGTSGNNTF